MDRGGRAGANGRGGEQAAEADGGDGHRGRGRSEPERQAAARARDLDRARELLERRLSERPGQAADLAAEGAASRARVEMRMQKHALETRQLAVELGRRPLPGAITFAAHGTHSSFDGGGVEKLDPSDE
jgi:hypothetical protein